MTLWDRIGSLARLAPSPHNTQPFRIAPVDDRRAYLVLLPERLLPREDHGNLYVTSAFGIFAAAMRRAAMHCGFTLAVTPRPELDVASLHKERNGVVLGEARIESPCPELPGADLMSVRRTSRLPFAAKLIAADTLASLRDVAQRHGHVLDVRSDAGFVARILDLNANAIVDNLDLDDERREIRSWSRFGPTPRFGDGLWNIPMHQPAWQLRLALDKPGILKWPGMRQLAIASYLRTQRAQHVALLSGPFVRWADLIVAGTMLFDFWMTMATGGVYMHPMGSMLTNPSYAARVAQAFGVADGWLVFRMGYSDQPPAAPRLETIVLRDHSYQ